MIPYYEAEIAQRLNTRWVRMPGEKLLGFTDKEDDETGGVRCLICNHEYMDWRWLDWPQAEYALRQERAAIMAIDQRAKDAADFDELCMELEGSAMMVEGEELFADELHFELGISAITTVISAMGGATMTCCRGHPRGHGIPGVKFYTYPKIAKLLVPYCKQFRCRIQNMRIEPYMPQHGIDIAAHSLMPLIDLAQALYDEFHEREGYLYKLTQE